MLPAVTAPPQNCALHEDGYSDASRRGDIEEDESLGGGQWRDELSLRDSLCRS